MADFVDLSIALSTEGNLERKDRRSYYSTHRETAQTYAPAYGITPSDFREGKYCAVERITLGTHDTTHLDSPWHYAPTSEGKPAKTIDQIPLEWCYSDGVVLDFHHKKKGEGITAKEVLKALDNIDYQLKPFDIVLIRTDTYKHYHEGGYEVYASWDDSRSNIMFN